MILLPNYQLLFQGFYASLTSASVAGIQGLLNGINVLEKMFPCLENGGAHAFGLYVGQGAT